MMPKKILALSILLAVMITVAAHAEPITREEVIVLEGMEERIITVRFESKTGYAFYYDPEIIEPSALLGGRRGRIEDFTPPGAENLEYWLSIHHTSTAGTDSMFRSTYGEPLFIDTDGDIFQYPYEGYYTHDKLDHSVACYAVDGKFVIFVICPTEAAEGFGSRVMQMLQSFEITS